MDGYPISFLLYYSTAADIRVHLEPQFLWRISRFRIIEKDCRDTVFDFNYLFVILSVLVVLQSVKSLV